VPPGNILLAAKKKSCRTGWFLHPFS